MFKEFKEFALRGNVLDMAIGIIIGGSFAKIVSSLIDDIIMPPIALLIGNIDFINLFINLTGEHRILEEAKSAGDITINYGKFINEIVHFLIIAFTVFIFIKQINKFRRNNNDYMSKLKVKSCPHCTKSIPYEAKRCPYCTSTLKKQN